MPARTNVRLELFDLLGRRVATLVDGTLEAGRHSVTWDRRSTHGSVVPPGIYTCRLAAGGRSARRQIIALP